MFWCVRDNISQALESTFYKFAKRTYIFDIILTSWILWIAVWQFVRNTTSVPKVIWEEGRVAALSHTYAVKSHWLQWRAKIRPQKYPFTWTNPQTPLPASSLDASDLRCQTTSGSDPLFFHNALGRPTDARTYVRTDRPTDRPRECLTTIGHYAPRATRPNNT